MLVTFNSRHTLVNEPRIEIHTFICKKPLLTYCIMVKNNSEIRTRSTFLKKHDISVIFSLKGSRKTILFSFQMETKTSISHLKLVSFKYIKMVVFKTQNKCYVSPLIKAWTFLVTVNRNNPNKNNTSQFEVWAFYILLWNVISINQLLLLLDAATHRRRRT